MAIIEGSMAGGVLLLLIECNQPSLDRYARQIERGTGVTPTSFHVHDLADQEASFFQGFDLVATTLFHIDEVRDVFVDKGLDTEAVIALMIEPSYVHVVREITELPQGTRVGLVCTTRGDARLMERALLGIGADHLILESAGIDEPERLAEVFASADYIYASPQAQEARRTPWPDGPPGHLYRDDVSAAALRLLRRRLARLAEAASG